jgi:CHAD domain-containing protein
MAFRFKPDKSVSSEIRRIVLRQLEDATSELTSVGDPESDEAIHSARRRVKKIRAVIRLIRPGPDETYRVVDKHLRNVNRLLAPVADGQGLIATLNKLERRYPKALPKRLVASIRAGLVDRGSQADRQAGSDHVLETVTGALRAEGRRVKHWQLRVEGFQAIAPGLEQCFRRARQAMLAAWRRPTAAHYHAWRGRVKNHWFHVRLLEGRCGDQLIADRRRLEALDGVLGEYHNLVLLAEVLVNDRYVSRPETARCLQVVLRYQRVLRQQAQSLGVRIYSEKPHGFVRRLKHLWGRPPLARRSRPSVA